MSVDKDALAKHAVEYLELKNDIEEAQAKQGIIRDAIQSLLPPFSQEGEEQKWDTGKASVAWVKGRRSEKVDYKTLKQRLILNGVPIGTIDEAFNAATTLSVGLPSVRITGKE